MTFDIPKWHVFLNFPVKNHFSTQPFHNHPYITFLKPLVPPVSSLAHSSYLSGKFWHLPPFLVCINRLQDSLGRKHTTLLCATSAGPLVALHFKTIIRKRKRRIRKKCFEQILTVKLDQSVCIMQLKAAKQIGRGGGGGKHRKPAHWSEIKEPYIQALETFF